MSISKKSFVSALVLAMIFSAGLLLGGCKKQTPAGSNKPVASVKAPASAISSPAKAPASAISSPAKAPASVAAIQQTICPITGKPINKNIYTVYNGRKVYFCCHDCLAKFKADPEKYVSKLPKLKK